MLGAQAPPPAATAAQQFPSRVIVHLDLDCFYCQVEQKRLGIPRDVPMCVQQWNGLIAVNYAARAAGACGVLCVVLEGGLVGT